MSVLSIERFEQLEQRFNDLERELQQTHTDRIDFQQENGEIQQNFRIKNVSLQKQRQNDLEIQENVIKYLF